MKIAVMPGQAHGTIEHAGIGQVDDPLFEVRHPLRQTDVAGFDPVDHVGDIGIEPRRDLPAVVRGLRGEVVAGLLAATFLLECRAPRAEAGEVRRLIGGGLRYHRTCSFSVVAEGGSHGSASVDAGALLLP